MSKKEKPQSTPEGEPDSAMTPADVDGEAVIEATVIRKDGTREELGEVSRQEAPWSLITKLFGNRHGNSTN